MQWAAGAIFVIAIIVLMLDRGTIAGTLVLILLVLLCLLLLVVHGLSEILASSLSIA